MEHEELISGRDFTRRGPVDPALAQAGAVHLKEISTDAADDELEETLGDSAVDEADDAGVQDLVDDAGHDEVENERADQPASSSPWIVAAARAAKAKARERAEAPLDEERPAYAPLSRSFLTTPEPEVEVTGLRAVLQKVGLSNGPRTAELEEAEDLRNISRLWAGPRTIAVANPKGGASKTPTTIALAAHFARQGSGVLAWCNNTTRGSLGWRTERDEHGATVLDLLPVADELLQSQARVSDLARFVHHQGGDKYDVLPSAAHLLSDQQRITADDFDAVWRVATKYYRLTFVDSGNEETAPNWLRMIDRADVLVVPMANRRDHAEAAREMLQNLRGRSEHDAHLVENAVVVVSEASTTNRGYVDELVDEFETESRAVVVVPHDAALGADHIRYSALGSATQRAYLRAAAAVATRLDQPSTHKKETQP